MTKQKIYDLMHQRTTALTEADSLLEKKDLDGWKAKMLDVDKLNAEIDASEKMLAEEGRFDDNEKGYVDLNAAAAQKQADEAKGKRVDDIRGSNEYAKAFATALRDQITVKRGHVREDMAPLYKALGESGGTPAGSDGGFLVPLDFDNMIHRLEKEYLDLSQFFKVEPVNTLSGWRAVETGTRKVLPKITEGSAIGKDDQPKFKKVSYSVEKYGDRLPVSHELMEDNTAGLLQYLAEWFAPKYILTKNSLLLALMSGLPEVALTAGSEVKLLKAAMIQRLNTGHSRMAAVITNQNGYAAMDGWEDKQGRPMLVPNPADPNVYRFMGRQISYADNDLIPDVETKSPIYVGNFRQLGTLFVRKGIEMAATDVGGDAWATDSYEIRGLCRMDAKQVDETAAFKATIAAAQGAG